MRKSKIFPETSKGLNKTQERESTNRTKYFNSRKVFNFNKANWSKFGELLPNILPTKYGSCVEEINKFVVESMTAQFHSIRLC